MLHLTDLLLYIFYLFHHSIEVSIETENLFNFLYQRKSLYFSLPGVYICTQLGNTPFHTPTTPSEMGLDFQ